MKIKNMLGYKLFKKNDDESVDIVRVVYVKKYSDGADPIEVTIRDEATKEQSKIKVDKLRDEYTPLEPDGLFTVSTVKVRDMSSNELSDDVIVTGTKFLNMKIGDVMPYCVCRQSATDIFYNVFCNTEDDMIAGLSMNRDNVPAGFDYGIMLACDEIIYSDFVNFYRTDTLDDVLSLFNSNKYDELLKKMYEAYINHAGHPEMSFKTEYKGWCSNLKKLLSENNFQNDLDEMLGITAVDFNIEEHLVEAKISEDSVETYITTDIDMRYWLSSIYKVNIGNIFVLEYNHDINLGEFNNSRYLILRDKDNKVYLLVYTISGEYKEAELQELDNQLDFSTKFRIKFYNKYNNRI